MKLNNGITLQRPLIGVLLGKKQLERCQKQYPDLSIQLLADANREARTTLYFFAKEDFDISQQRVNGTYFNENTGIWDIDEFPLPDVFYNRLGRLNKRTKELIARHNILTINPIIAFLNKWRVYEALAKNKEISPHLPPTKLYRDFTDLNNLLKSNKSLYLKACNGRQGRQVMRVTNLRNGKFECSYFVRDELIIRQITLEELIKLIYVFFGKRNFIIQQAIDLLTVGDRIVDIRAEVQRNGKGELEIVGMPVRISSSRSPVTTHASAYRFEDFFAEFMDFSPEEIAVLQGRIENLVKKIYQWIEKFYGPFGEIGIDVALDKNGDLWFFEGNIITAKKSLMKAYDEDTVLKAFLNPLEYAKFIAATKKTAKRQPPSWYKAPVIKKKSNKGYVTRQRFII